MIYSSDVREALSTAITARKEKLEIYRIMYWRRYPVSDEYDEEKAKEGRDNLAAQRKILRGLRDVRRGMRDPLRS